MLLEYESIWYPIKLVAINTFKNNVKVAIIMEWLVKSFKLLCLIATIATVSWCLYNFILNEDVSSVTFQQFHNNPENAYPSISFCVLNPLIQEKLDRYGTNVTVGKYQAFLAGRYWDDSVAGIDYDQVTLEFNDYILGYDVLYFNRTRVRLDLNATPWNEWNPPYISLTDFGKKCISIKIPYQQNQEIRNIELFFKPELFENRAQYGWIDWEKDITKSIYVVGIHYFQQVVLAHTWISNFPKRIGNSSKGFTMEFSIGNVEYVQRRNKLREPCLSNFPNYDKDKIEWIIKTVGCRPAYWKSFTTLRACTTKQEMFNLATLFSNICIGNNTLEYIPCRSIESIQYSYAEHAIESSRNETSNAVSLKAIFQVQKFKEIKMVSSNRKTDVP